MTRPSNQTLRRQRAFARWTRTCAVAVGAAALTVPMFGAGTAVAACDATCQAQFVAAHDATRTKLNSGLMPAPGNQKQPTANPALGALALDNNLATGAQTWANACTFAHSGTQGRGENIYASVGTPLTPAVAVTDWESESAVYTYGTIPAPNQSAVGHYTQLVWASTNAVGCAITHCTTGSPFPPQFGTEWDFAVCQYTPPGNFTGQFPYVAGVAQPPVPGGPLDVDANGQYEPLADGLIILRYMFGLTGNALINGALGVNAPTTTPQAMLIKLNLLRPQFDIDLNGQIEPLADGLLIIRYLFGLRGNALVAGAIGGNNPQRNTAALIEPYLLSLRP